MDVLALFDLIDFLHNPCVGVFLDSLGPVLSYIMDQLINIIAFGFEKFVILPEIRVNLLGFIKGSHALQGFGKILLGDEWCSV